MGVTDANLGIQPNKNCFWNYPDWIADREKRKRDNVLKNLGDKDTIINSDGTTKKESNMAMNKKIVFSASDQDVLATQFDLMHTEKRRDSNQWEMSDIVDEGGGKCSFTVTGDKGDANFTLDYLTPYLVSGVTAKEVTTEANLSKQSTNALIEAAMKSGKPDQVVNSYLKRKLGEEGEDGGAKSDEVSSNPRKDDKDPAKIGDGEGASALTKEKNPEADKPATDAPRPTVEKFLASKIGKQITEGLTKNGIKFEADATQYGVMLSFKDEAGKPTSMTISQF